MMHFFQSRRRAVRLLSFLLIFCLLFAVFSLVQTLRLRQKDTAAATASQRAMREFSENLESIETDLQKSVFCNSSTQLSALALNLSKCAACAKCSLSQLTNADLVSDEIYKFLSQVGDFTVAVGKKATAGQSVSSADRKGLSALAAYAKSLTEAITPLDEGYFDGTVALEKTRLQQMNKATAPKYFSDEVNRAAKSFSAYPTLLYDGPFADTVLQRDARAIQEKDEIAPDIAARRAAQYLNCTTQQLLREDDVNGTLALYCFSKGEHTVSLTKRGGLLCSITSTDAGGETTIDEKSAARIARRYLRAAGYYDMKESYYSTYDGICTINLAYSKGGVIYYADLIKVSVALDKGVVTGVDARGYLMNHTERRLPAKEVSIRTAVSTLAPNLTLLDTATTLIPCDDGKERLCYELHCKSDDGQEVLVYTDVTTGEEADLQLLLYSDHGVLAR